MFLCEDKFSVVVESLGLSIKEITNGILLLSSQSELSSS